MKPARTILPAAAPQGAAAFVDASKNKVTKKRNTVSRACNCCRRIKGKCDGVRPTCAKCQERNTECVYDTEEGKSRNASLRDYNEALNETLDRHKEVLTKLLHGDLSQDARNLIRSLGLSPPPTSTSPLSHTNGNTPRSDTQVLAPSSQDVLRPSAPPGPVSDSSFPENAVSFFSQYQPLVSQNVSPETQDMNSLLTAHLPPVPFDPSQSLFPWDATSSLTDPSSASFREVSLPFFGDVSTTSLSPQPFPRALGALPSMEVNNPLETTVQGPQPPPGWSNEHVSPFRQTFEYDHQHFLGSHPQTAFQAQPGNGVRGNSWGSSQIPPQRDYYTGSNLTSGDPPLARSLSTGYDPNDGRVSGRQEGWHFLLVVREAEEIPPTEITIQSPNAEYLRYYQGTTSSTYLPFGPSSIEENTPPEPLNPFSQPDSLRRYPQKRPINNNRDSQVSSSRSSRGAVAAFGNLPMSSAVLANGYPPSTQNQQMLNFWAPEHLIPSLIVDENSDLARLYIGFKDAGQQMIANGLSAAQILGDLNHVYVDLILRDRMPEDSVSVSNWASELMKNILGIDKYVHLAWAGFLARYMRWVILPTKANYAQIPDMMKPTRVQRLIPHSPALDLVPHPGMRDALMQHYVDWLTCLQTDQSGLSVWSGTDGEAVTTCAETGRLILSPEFEMATRIQDNWSVNDTILRTYAEPLRFGIRVRQTGRDSPTGTGGARGRRERQDAHQNDTRESINVLEGIRSDQKRQRAEKTLSRANSNASSF